MGIRKKRFGDPGILNLIVAIAALFLFAPPISAKGDLKEYYEVRFYFGTQVSIHCFYEPSINISEVSKRCWRKATQIQDSMDIKAMPAKGNLAQLNLEGVKGVHVNDDIFQVLKESLEYSRITDGAFDVTILPLVQLWKNAAKQGKIPSPEELERVKDTVGYQNLRLQEPDMVFFLNKEMQVDLGSPASGYFCDQVAKILLHSGIQHFLVDGGGELFANGLDEGLRPWRIGIQDPFDKEKIIAVIDIQNQGVSTSGNYEKFYQIGSERFSHIIDPLTGFPEKGTVSVTVIADTAQKANELSTGLCVLGGKGGLALVRTLKNVEALIIEQQNGNIRKFATEKFLQNHDSATQ